MKRAACGVVARAEASGIRSGAAAAFGTKGSARRLAVRTPSPLLVSARARRAGTISRRRAHDARAPRLTDWS